MSHIDTIELLLVEQTLAMARTLVAGAEPLKALDLVEFGGPVVALENPEVKRFAGALREQVSHAFNDAEYLNRYTVRFKELYALETEPKPFSDAGLLTLDRAIRAKNVIEKVAPGKVLSVGAGDCTLEKSLLETHPEMSLDVSELNNTASEAVAALQALFPNRVHPVGRFDTDTRTPPGPYDLILCLEVIEHVQDAVLFLCNLREALAEGGTLVLSTPNAMDWIEAVHLERFGGKAWYQHLRAYTAKTLNDDCLSVDLLATIVTTFQGALFLTARRGGMEGDPVERFVERVTDVIMPKVKALPPGSTVYSYSILGSETARVECLDGVVLYPASRCPEGTPVLQSSEKV